MRFELMVLGCGAAAPTDRFLTTSQALNIHETWMLIDAGEGVQSSIRRMRIPWNRLGYVFISHMHGDHVLGLPGWIGSMNLHGRTEPLHLVGPPELEQFLLSIHTSTHSYLRFPLVFHVLETKSGMQKVLDLPRFEVSAFSTRHRIPTWGFRFDEKTAPRNIRKEMLRVRSIGRSHILSLKAGKGIRTEDGEWLDPEIWCEPALPPRSYVYAADTTYSPNVVEAALGATLLYHESTFMTQDKSRAKDTYHSTARDAARVALEAGVTTLLLGHFSSRYRDLSLLLKEAQEVFPRTQLASDLSRWPIEHRN
jgi:ribonuclease Z